jgi:hypothetical protein
VVVGRARKGIEWGGKENKKSKERKVIWKPKKVVVGKEGASWLGDKKIDGRQKEK